MKLSSPASWLLIIIARFKEEINGGLQSMVNQEMRVEEKQRIHVRDMLNGFNDVEYLLRTSGAKAEFTKPKRTRVQHWKYITARADEGGVRGGWELE